MTVYVDDMHRRDIGRFGRMKMSHMIADSEEELHAMAQKIGVKRHWLHGDHYDICLAMRAKAVKLGAVEVTMRELACMVMLRRCGLAMGEPEDAADRLAKHRFAGLAKSATLRVPRRRRAAAAESEPSR